MKTDNISKKISKIKLLLTDVDGVLTDGGMYYTAEGLTMKRFNVKDGMGAVILQKNGIEVGLISTDKSDIGKIRGERLKFDYVFTGVIDKKGCMEQICLDRNITPENVAFIGDDINDLEILSAVGFSVSPFDANKKVKEIVDYISEIKGGEGVFREIADLIIEVQSK